MNFALIILLIHALNLLLHAPHLLNQMCKISLTIRNKSQIRNNLIIPNPLEVAITQWNEGVDKSMEKMNLKVCNEAENRFLYLPLFFMMKYC